MLSSCHFNVKKDPSLLSNVFHWLLYDANILFDETCCEKSGARANWGSWVVLGWKIQIEPSTTLVAGLLTHFWWSNAVHNHTYLHSHIWVMLGTAYFSGIPHSLFASEIFFYLDGCRKNKLFLVLTPHIYTEKWDCLRHYSFWGAWLLYKWMVYGWTKLYMEGGAQPFPPACVPV